MPTPQHPRALTTKGFWLAGAYNVLGMLFFSKLFTNTLLGAIDPDVFSWLGQVAIVLWGLAYWSVARSYHHVPLLVAVFAVEKCVYAVTWALWLIANGHSLTTIASESLLTGVFYTIYGAGDAAFCVFFAWVAFGLATRDTTSAS